MLTSRTFGSFAKGLSRIHYAVNSTPASFIAARTVFSYRMIATNSNSNSNSNSNNNNNNNNADSKNSTIPSSSYTTTEPSLDQINEDAPTHGVNWANSFHGLSAEPFSAEVAKILMEPVDPNDVEIKPDGIIYLPEIKYRRILNRAFAPGGWGLAPRSETHITTKSVSREYALVCLGRLVSIARGENDYFDPQGIPTALEGAKSNALMRCCKDLGIASELWDPRFIREFKKEKCVEVWATHVTTNKKRKLWRRKDDTLSYPYKE